MEGLPREEAEICSYELPPLTRMFFSVPSLDFPGATSGRAVLGTRVVLTCRGKWGVRGLPLGRGNPPLQEWGEGLLVSSLEGATPRGLYLLADSLLPQLLLPNGLPLLHGSGQLLLLRKGMKGA